MTASSVPTPRSASPFWWEAAPRPKFPESDLPAKADVVVIGSGYTGLTAALYLARYGRRVVVADAQDAGYGASTRNGGVIGSRLKISFSRLARERGMDYAKAMYGESRRAYEFAVNLIREEELACDLEVRGRFMGARFAKDYDGLRRDAEAMHKHLGIESKVFPRNEVPSEVGTDTYHGGVLRTLFASVHPGLFHQGLLDRAIAAGVQVSPFTRVERIEKVESGFEVHTSRGRIACRNIVAATNGYTSRVTPYLRRRVIPIESSIFVTEPLDKAAMDRSLPTRRLIGDTSRLHHYFRPTPDGTRVMFGGRAGLNHLYGEFLRIFPHLRGTPVAHSWSGNVAYTFDTMPHLGEHDGIHFAMGYCGSGLAFGPYFGFKIAQRIVGGNDTRTEFDALTFETRPLYTGWPWFLPGVILVYALRDRFGI
jgi:glycine/D-amino acid oxidase-like deaminating enzyme